VLGDKRGAAAVVGMVIGIVVVSILVIVGLIVMFQVQNSLPSAQLSSTQQSQLSTFVNAIVGAFNMTTIIPIVLIVAAIIGVFFLFLRGGGGQ